MHTDISTYNDKELLLLIAQDNEEAFKEVFNRHKDKVYKLAHFLSLNDQWAEDTVQDVFLKIWTGRKEINKIEYLVAYFATMTRNHVNNLFRKQAAEELMKTRITETKPQTQQAENILAYQELEHALEKAMQQLTPQQRKIFQASKLQGLRISEMAQQFNMNIETVKKHLTNAMSIMRRELLANKVTAEMIIALYIITR